MAKNPKRQANDKPAKKAAKQQSGKPAKKAAPSTTGGKTLDDLSGKPVRGRMNSLDWAGPFSGGGTGYARQRRQQGKTEADADGNADTGATDGDPAAPERAISTSDIDWSLSAAWKDPATRARLVGLVEGEIAAGNLNPYGDYTVFMDKTWQLLKETPEYKARFPGLVRLEAQTGYNPLTSMTPDEYLKMEGLYDNAMAYYGIPGGVFNRDQMISDLVENQVTPQEMQDRLDMAAAAAVSNSDITAKLLEYEGVEPGHVVAFYLNPDDAIAAIRKKQQTLQIGGMMARYGFQGAKSDAQALQQEFGGAEGLSTGGVASTLDRAAARRGLMSGLGETVTESDVLRGSASENDLTARLRSVEAQRQGRFNTSGGASEGRTGVSGLGSARNT